MKWKHAASLSALAVLSVAVVWAFCQRPNAAGVGGLGRPTSAAGAEPGASQQGPPQTAAFASASRAATSATPAVSSRASSPPRTYRGVLIPGVPHVRQKTDFCGEAAAEMWLRKLGLKNADQDYVFDQSGLDPLAARGCYTADLVQALRKIGFDTGSASSAVPAAGTAAGMEQQWAALHADLAAGVPSIICMRTADGPAATEHFRLVLGYDQKTDEVIYHEPAEDDGAYRRMPRQTLLSLWPLKYSPARWVVIRIRLAATDKIKDPPPAETFTPADYAQHIMKLRKLIPAGDGFTVVVQPPFVVIGDEPARTVSQRSAATVRWAVDLLKKEYFPKDPAEILDVWLFRSESSYRKHAKDIFGDEPGTPFGYYSSAARALIMNAATGGGTLVHELVHPFIEANFPHCPPWLNEGLGSLYEQCGQENGRIWGYTNWRLQGLQEAIRAGEGQPFDHLLAMDVREFYGRGAGANYAQARYLCYYLQQQGKLREFYHKFHANLAADPTGLQTLKDVLGADDLAAFQKRWEAFVMTLTFP